MIEELLASIRVEDVTELAKEAGRRTLDFYGRDLKVDYKEDDSPLTKADRASHALISQRLVELTPEIPVISEESEVPDFQERSQYAGFWLIDPLDGTKEFLKQNGEYTVNIALISGGRPIFGVVGVPCQDKIYVAMDRCGAFVETATDPARRLKSRPVTSLSGLTLAVSRSHGSSKIDALLEKLEQPQLIRVGSALKFCLVAEGVIDCYPRFGPLMEWDTAAAHLVVQESGGDVRSLDGTPLRYNKERMIHDSGLLVSANQALADLLVPMTAALR